MIGFVLRRALAVFFLATGMVASGGLLSPAAAAYQQSPSPSWVPDGTVYAMAQYGDRIYLGGTFTSLKNPATGQVVGRSRLAAVHASTGALLPWNPGANNTVRGLAVGGNGTVYAGGAFTAAAGKAAARAVAITPNGTAVTGWKAEANQTVRDIALDSSGVYLVGAFVTVNGVARARVARVSAQSGAVDLSFNARVADGVVFSVALSGDKLLLGGSFTKLSGAARKYSGSVFRGSGAVSSWAPASQCDGCVVFDLTTDGTRVYQALAGPGGRVVAFSLSSGARAWVHYADGDVQAVAVYGNVVYVGGHFSNIAGLKRRQLLTVEPVNGRVLSYALSFVGSDAPGIWVMSADAAALRLGGGFQLANNPAGRYAAFRTVA